MAKRNIGLIITLVALSAGCSSDKSDGTDPRSPDAEGRDATQDVLVADSNPSDVSADSGDMGRPDDPRGIACADALETIPTNAWHPEHRIDPQHHEAVARAAQVCLSNYIQVKTTNPPADDDPGEVAAVRFFETVFQRLGLSTQRAPLSRDDDPRRLSVVATREGIADQLSSLVLLNHTDAVPAEGTWTHEPFSGHFDGVHVWGRGALDMKGIGITQLVALSVLHRADVDLLRDIHFVAVADEEIGGQGAEYVAATRLQDGVPEAFDPLGLRPGIVLNEGGNGVRDDLVPRRDTFVIGVEEKGKVWSQFGHEDPGALAAAIVKLGVIDAPSSDTFGTPALQTSLSQACTLTAMHSDSQKANVQPMNVELAFDCEAGLQSDMETALANVGAGLEVAPVITVQPTLQGTTEQLVVTINFGVGGHGAAGVSVNALNLATSALVSTGVVDESELVVDQAERDRYFDWVMSPANQMLVSRLARDFGETASQAAEALVTEADSTTALLNMAHSFLPIDSPFKTSCSWTNVRYESGAEAFAKLDCRLNSNWPDGPAFEAELAGFMSRHGATLRSDTANCFDCSMQDFNSSPFGDDVDAFALLQYLVERSSPDALVAPYLFPASSDSFFFRSVGVPTYAIWPIALHQEELEAIHAIDERAPVTRMGHAIDIYAQMVHGLANDRVPPPAGAQNRLDTTRVTCSQWDPDASAWTPMTSNRLTCDDTHFHCTVADDTPRFLRARASVLDAKIIHVTRMTPDFQPANELLPADAVDSTLYASRNIAANGAVQDGTRVFPDEEFEIDTGPGEQRSFSLHCSTPLHQIIAIGDRAVLEFYRD